MKITTKREYCLWRGKELPTLCGSVKPYLDTGAVEVLLASNLDLETFRFCEMLDLLMSQSGAIHIYYPRTGEVELIHCPNPTDLLTHIIGDGFAEVIYIFDEMHSFLVYSNSRDSLSLWIVPQSAVTEQHVQDWDSAFEDHLQRVGIGFGDEGKSYGRELLSVLTETDPRSYKRFTSMLRALQ